jgi:hypothetical protein
MVTGPERPNRKRLALIVLVVVIIIIVAGGAFLPRMAKSRIESINCANILSSLGVAARTYAMDYADTYAPDVLCMSNELSTPKILICPAEKSKQPAQHFSKVSPSNTTYEYLVSGMKQKESSTNAIFRCPIHGHVVREDGVVIRGDGTVQHGKANPFF